jgi:cytochrome c oxidase subunit IV
METETRPVSGKGYVITWIVLVALTVVSFSLAFVELGAAGPVLALSIAFIKMLLVVYVFMHLIEARFPTRLIGLVSLIFIVLLCLGIAADVHFRRPLDVEWPDPIAADDRFKTGFGAGSR